jgi:hypothetical protein
MFFETEDAIQRWPWSSMTDFRFGMIKTNLEFMLSLHILHIMPRKLRYLLAYYSMNCYVERMLVLE